MDEREKRRKARANWPIRRFAMGTEPLIDELDSSTAADRVRQVWVLTRQIWKMSGKSVERPYSRENMPGQLIREDE